MGGSWPGQGAHAAMISPHLTIKHATSASALTCLVYLLIVRCPICTGTFRLMQTLALFELHLLVAPCPDTIPTWMRTVLLSSAC